MGDGNTITIDNLEDQVGKVVEQTKELQEEALALINKNATDEQSLRQRAQSLDSSICRLRSLIDSLLSDKLLDPKLADKADHYSFSFPFFLLSLLLAGFALLAAAAACIFMLFYFIFLIN